jgi:23S rRNA (uracil1939-C5)-methyltransferase
MAQKAAQVVGAEIVPQAIADAKENARRNHIENAQFFCGDTGAVAQKLSQEGLHPDVICVDPPRKGLAPEVPDILAALSPKRIVYVSCDPATLARDLKRLSDLGYQAIQAQAVDLFPRTRHVETVVLLRRQEGDELALTTADRKPESEIKTTGRKHYGSKTNKRNDSRQGN